MTQRILCSCISFLFCFLMQTNFAFAASFDSDAGISREQLTESLAKNTDLNPEQIHALIQTLQQQLGVKPEQKIPIQGYLYSSGMNWAFLLDHDTWYFDATIRDPQTNELIDMKELFLCDFHNGGFKFEVAYKWMFTFIPSGVNVDELHGGIYGRGVGLVADALLGLEGSWLPAKNRKHDIFHVAIKVGLGGGLVFPKMEFKLRQINENTRTALLRFRK
ncbi:hypothetical protein [Bdellovibrio bacteriovorus]|uniref:Uncharacterized protein n=1 Tax=Bdellovibrio bacteriovorus TaxID=959 RepID=A0A150WKA9_BDEBC|nr:hypothetical protein [Bdellovibrio bacteriovorus]KYG64400.1 hypothetical protein AZI85_02970 [Bdellovibrio bacteriovorus]